MLMEPADSWLGPLDHAGYLALDLDGAVGELCAKLGVQVSRRFARPQFSLLGVYLGSRHREQIEVFTFSDAELLNRRLQGLLLRLDHLAFKVEDIDAASMKMRRAGIRFTGPDQRHELFEPVQLGGVRHLWTIPETSAGLGIQILQR